ncbi:calcium-binding protein [Streptomyces sp. NPDC052721]|uniref:calcium-binding protein n=1 Tax=Streptomyces sp. NPDC052721 TaxID=3154955 RepID=UPI00344AEF0D
MGGTRQRRPEPDDPECGIPYQVTADAPEVFRLTVAKPCRDDCRFTIVLEWVCQGREGTILRSLAEGLTHNVPDIAIVSGLPHAARAATAGVVAWSDRRSRMTVRLSACLIAASLLALGMAGETSGQARATCFGRPATITGSGTINGTSGRDVIVGSAGADTIDGRGGNDLICALGGNDTIQGGRGDDEIDGGSGNDFMIGDVYATTGDAKGGGNDRLFGRDGDDSLGGDSFADAGNAEGGGRDHLDGGPGDEIMAGDSVASVGDARGAGDDVLLGGPGAEILTGDSSAGGRVTGDGGDDVVDLGQDGGVAAIGDHNISRPTGGTATGAGHDRVTGGSGNDVLIGDSSVVDAARTSARSDVLNGRGGNDTLFGDNADFDATRSVGTAGGDDRLLGGDGADTLHAGPRDDLLDGGPGAPDRCDGEAGYDSAVRCEIVSHIP